MLHFAKHLKKCKYQSELRRCLQTAKKGVSDLVANVVKSKSSFEKSPQLQWLV